MTRPVRLALIFLPGLLAIPVLLAYGPIAQDPAYHDFADQRTVLGIPHFGDVITNLAFVVVGVAGLLTRPRIDFALFFLGVLLTGIGSGYYHLHPTDATLAWDRAPMTLGFMGLFAAMIRERVSARWGRALLGPLILFGLWSVWYWAMTGDLRPYVLAQYYPLVTIVLMLLWLPGADRAYWLAAAGYAAAKVTEMLDKPIFDLGGVVSGHNLKHVLAAVGAYALVGMLLRRA